MTLLRVLFLALTVAIPVSAWAAAEKPDCEAFLARDAFVRLAEGALKKTVITATDLQRVAASPRPLNPLLGKPASIESVSYQKAFATVIGSMTPESWPEVQRAILQLIDHASRELEARDDSRKTTRPILKPVQIFKKKVFASTWLVDWVPSGTDVAFNFWDGDRSEWIQQVQLKTGFKKKKDLLSFDLEKLPEQLVIDSVFQMANGKTYLSGWNQSSFRWISNAVAYTHLDEGSRNATLQTSNGRLFFSRMVRGLDGIDHHIQVLEMADDGTWTIRKSYQTRIPHAASLFEHKGHVFAAFEIAQDKLRVECVTSPAVRGRTLSIKGKTTTFNSQVLQADTATYLLTFYYDDNDRAALELHDPFRPGETRIFESNGEMGFEMDTAKLWRDPITARFVMAIMGHNSVLFYNLESPSPILKYSLPVPRSMSWRVVDDQVYLATIGEDYILRIFQIYNEVQK